MAKNGKKLKITENPFFQKKVLIRADLNGNPLETFREEDSNSLVLPKIDQIIPNLKILLAQEAKIILMSHLGRPRPEMKSQEKFSLKPIADQIQKKTGIPTRLIPDYLGKSIRHSKNPEIILFENLRFHPEEEQNDLEFAQRLARHADIYINDAFACSHRKHASMYNITKFLPSFPGKNLLGDLLGLQTTLANFERPLLAIVAGNKSGTKMKSLLSLTEVADCIGIYGGLANSFLKVNGKNTGSYQPENLQELEDAQNILDKAHKENCRILLPQDFRNQKNESLDLKYLDKTLKASKEEDNVISDIGEQSIRYLDMEIHHSKSIIWNGTLGKTEEFPFHIGTSRIASSLKTLFYTPFKNNVSIIVGGGHTLTALRKIEDIPHFSHTTNAGGALLEWINGKPENLPALQVLGNLPFYPFAKDILPSKV